MNQKTVGLTLRATIIALALILVVGSPALPPLDGVAYAQGGPTLTATALPDGSVDVSWTAVGGADSYDLYKQPDGGSWSAAMSKTDITYNDTAVTAGAKYFYIVRAVTAGVVGPWSNTVSVTLPGGTAAPTGKPALSAAADGLTAVDLTWGAVPTATSYDLRRWNSETSAWDPIGNNPTGTSYKDTGRESGEQYWYVIRAVNDGGNGPWSSEDGVGYTTITMPDTDPIPVLELEHLSRERVKLTWSLVGEGAEYDLQRMRTSPGATTATVSWARLPSGLVSDGEYTDEAATYVAGSTSTTYSYRVQAVVDGEHGDYSNTVSISIPASGVLPPAPSLGPVSATSASSISVDWSVVPVAASYELRFKVEDGDYGSPFTPRTRPYLHSGRSAGTEYTYQVRSKNVNGYSDWSSAESATTPAVASGTGTLPTPRNLKVEDDTGDHDDVSTTPDTPGIKVTWSPVTGATHYELLIWNPDASPAAWATVAELDDDANEDQEATYNTEAVGGVTIAAGTMYYFVVRAVDDQGDSDTDTAGVNDDYSDWSAPANGRTKSLIPGAPTDLDVTDRDSSSIWLSWTPAAEVAGGAVTSYTIEWRQGTSQSRRVITVEGRENYLHTGLTHNTEYFYRVRANNSAGSSGWWPDESQGTAADTVDCDTTTTDTEIAQCRTTEEMGKTAARQLGPPSNFRSEADSETSIKLSWDAVNGATGYEIQRWDTAADPDAWVVVDANGDAVDGNITTATSYDHTVTAPTNGGNVTEYFIIRTISSGGVVSNWSTALTAMSKAIQPDAPTLDLEPTGQTTVRLSWADGDNTVAGQVLGYTVQFAEDAASTANLGDDRFTSQTFTVGANPKYYIHTGLKTGTRYTYRIRANLANDVDSQWSATTAAAPAILGQVVTRPAKPELTTTATATETVSRTIRLTWAPAILEGDDLVTAGDYEIQRRQSVDDPDTDVNEAAWEAVTGFTLLADTGGICDPMCIVSEGTTDSPLAGGTKYYYRIRVNLADDEVDNAPGVTSYWDLATARTPSN